MNIDDLKFLISTDKGLFFWQNKILYNVSSEMFSEKMYYGITWNSEVLFVSHYSGKILEIKKNGDSKTVPVELMYDLHQILFTDKNDLLICDTKSNSIVCYNNKETKKINWTNKTQDINHINSIFKKKDEYYVCCHNNKNPSSIIVLDKNFDYKKEYKNVGQQNHNVYVDDNYVITLDSLNGQIAKIDKKSNNVIFKKINYTFSYNNVFLRGFSKVGQFNIVGVCYNGINTAERNKQSSYLLFMNENFDTIQTLELPACGQIREIRCTNYIDMAHNGMLYDYDFSKYKIVKN